MFPTHLALLKAQYYFEKEFDNEDLKALALLNSQNFDMGASLFKLTMHANNKQALEPPLIAFWSNLGF
jgi:hypothetical protein